MVENVADSSKYHPRRHKLRSAALLHNQPLPAYEPNAYQPYMLTTRQLVYANTGQGLAPHLACLVSIRSIRCSSAHLKRITTPYNFVGRSCGADAEIKVHITDRCILYRAAHDIHGTCDPSTQEIRRRKWSDFLRSNFISTKLIAIAQINEQTPRQKESSRSRSSTPFPRRWYSMQVIVACESR